MRQVCFKNKEFIEYVNENMVVLYGFYYSGRNMTIGTEKVELEEGINPYKPDKEFKYVVPFAKPLTAKKNSGVPSGSFSIKDIRNDIKKELALDDADYMVIDGRKNLLTSAADINKAMAGGYSVAKFLDFFKQGNAKLAKNGKQVKGSTWRKGFWGTLQAEYMMKTSDPDFSKIKAKIDAIGADESMPEDFLKEAEKLKDKLVREVSDCLKKVERDLSKSSKRKGAIERIKELADLFSDEEEIQKEIKEIIARDKNKD